MYQRAGVIINRMKSKEMEQLVDLGDLELLGFIPEDDSLAMADIEVESLLQLAEENQALVALKKALIKMEVL